MVSRSHYPSASLYVGDLSPEVSEGHLFEVFNKVGPVASIRVCRDAITRRSLCYAYVNFYSVADAERALDILNNMPIKSKACRMMWSQRDPSMRKSGVGNIFIKNLHKSIDHKTLFDTFSVFGNILSCKVATDASGVSKGYAFVHYETQEMADRAIQKVHNMMLEEQQVYVGRFIPRKERQASRDAAGFTNVYVKNLDVDTIDDTKLREIFQSFGPITNAKVMLSSSSDGTPPRSRGFGFINFANPDDAKKAVQVMHEQQVVGKTLYVRRAQKKAERLAELRQKFEQQKQERASRYNGINLYVKNLDDSEDDSKLRAHFAPFGSISSAKIMRDDKGNSRGFGFVCFTTPEEAQRAIHEMNGKIFGAKPLYVALAQRKDVRRAYLESQHAQRIKRRNFPSNSYILNPPTAVAPFPAYSNPNPPAAMFYTAQGIPISQNIPPQFVYQSMNVTSHRTGGNRSTPTQYQTFPNYVVPAVPHQNSSRTSGQKNLSRNRFNSNRIAKDQNEREPGTKVDSISTRPVENESGEKKEITELNNNNENHEMLEASLSSYPVDQQFNILGDKLFSEIQKSQPDLAGKITGMIIERASQSPNGIQELVQLLSDSIALSAKIAEALGVLADHNILQEASSEN